MRAPDGAPPRRVGVFGGTFDPPHIGHVTVARDVADGLDLDRLIWMPAGEPPHKVERPVSPARVRLDMARAAAAADPRFEVSDLEMRRPGPSYTVDTLRELRTLHPRDEIFLILGADQVGALEEGWREPETILQLARLAIMDRGGVSAAAELPGLPGTDGVVRVEVTRVDVSSTEIRSRVARGESVEGLVPDAVADVIEREELYGAAGPRPRT